MIAATNREGGASAPLDLRSIAELAADYRAAYSRWGYLLDRQEEAEARAWALRKRGAWCSRLSMINARFAVGPILSPH